MGFESTFFFISECDIFSSSLTNENPDLENPVLLNLEGDLDLDRVDFNALELDGLYYCF